MRGFMIRCPDPIPGQPGLLRSSFACMVLPRSTVAHACTSRAVEDWFWIREMTGEAAFGREVEQAQQATML